VNWKLEAALSACLILGLRHGFDYDHLAAITDITAMPGSRMRAMRLGLLYALGHALTVVALGILVIQLHIPLPAWLDRLAERLIGATLIVLGIAVIAGFFHPHAHSHHMQSRIAAAINLFRTLHWKLLSLFQPDRERPALFAWNYSERAVFLVGMLHGVGAETPSQLMLFFLTARLGGASQGILGLAAFASGLVLMNSLMTASLTGLFRLPAQNPVYSRILIWGGAIYSCALGILFLSGYSTLLPSLQ